MLFRTYSAENERSGYFIEIQACRLPRGTAMEAIFSPIEFHKKDSLYVYGDDDERFLRHYGEIFAGGVYHNGKRGAVDIWGLNYYTPAQVDAMIEKLLAVKPLEYSILLEWLEQVRADNGIYLLGY